MFVDSHCHLNFPDYADRFDQVLADMAQAQVDRALCISTTLEDFPAVHRLAVTHHNLWATVGVHPDNEGVREPTLQDLLDGAALPRVVGIGETGLDYYRLGERTVADMAWQRDRFRTHIRAGRRAGKPLVVHTRDSAADTLRVLKEEGADTVGGVMHCFTENWEIASLALDLGFYLSFSGIVTFKNAAIVKEVARKCPLDRILVETDSPYLAPVPFRGKPNEPAYVRYVAEEIASLRSQSVETIHQATSDNFFSLFTHAKRP